MYTLRELFDNLDITLTELKRRSGISDVTLTSIRDGNSARRSTINRLLKTFSDIYGEKLTLKNVGGIIIQGKPVIIDEKPYSSTVSISEKTQPEKPQIRNVEPKRDYVRRMDTGLPDGCILASVFAESHGVNKRTFLDHMRVGLDRELVAFSERDKPNRPKEKERFLTAEQQASALKFWKRHGVQFHQCEREDCPCH